MSKNVDLGLRVTSPNYIFLGFRALCDEEVKNISDEVFEVEFNIGPVFTGTNSPNYSFLLQHTLDIHM